MVSRGGRSKGCTNCRRRRVKCDESRPICNRCKKRGLQCDGPKDPTWISQNNTFPPSPPDAEALTPPDKIPGGISFVAFEDDLCLAYTRKHLLRGGSVELAADLVQSRHTADDSASPGFLLLRKAIFSLAITFFGSQNRQKAVTSRGYRQYGETLKELNTHLALSQFQTTNETILTAVTCMLLEIFLPTGPNHFLKHVRGLEAITEARGPPSPNDTQSAVIFHNLRIMSIIAALAQGKCSVWAKDEWKQIPCAYQDEASLTRHAIFQVLADCATLIKTCIRVSGDGSPEDLQPLLSSANAALETLMAIYPRWERLNDTMMNDKTSNIAKDFRIANHECATTYMLYNAAYICILRIIHTVTPSPKYMSLRTAAALKIVRCLELKDYQKREGDSESNTIGFISTKIAWEALGGFSSPEGRRLARTVKSMSNGTFAMGAWEHADDPFKRQHPTITAESSKLHFQPIWAEHQADGTGKPQLVTRREIFHMGEKKKTPRVPFQAPAVSGWSPPSMPAMPTTSMESPPFVPFRVLR